MPPVTRLGKGTVSLRMQWWPREGMLKRRTRVLFRTWVLKYIQLIWSDGYLFSRKRGGCSYTVGHGRTCRSKDGETKCTWVRDWEEGWVSSEKGSGLMKERRRTRGNWKLGDQLAVIPLRRKQDYFDGYVLKTNRLNRLINVIQNYGTFKHYPNRYCVRLVLFFGETEVRKVVER